MFQFSDVDRRTLTLILIALMACFTAVGEPAKAQTPDPDPFQNSILVHTGPFPDPFQDPDEDDPDPDPFQNSILVHTDPCPDPFQDPDEDDPDPDPFQNTALVYTGPCPDPFQDPDEDDPDPDPFVLETYPLALREATTVRFQLGGNALMTLSDGAGHTMFLSGSGSDVVMTLPAGSYEIQLEAWGESQGAVYLGIEPMPLH